MARPHLTGAWALLMGARPGGVTAKELALHCLTQVRTAHRCLAELEDDGLMVRSYVADPNGLRDPQSPYIWTTAPQRQMGPAQHEGMTLTKAE